MEAHHHKVCNTFLLGSTGSLITYYHIYNKNYPTTTLKEPVVNHPTSASMEKVYV